MGATLHKQHQSTAATITQQERQDIYSFKQQYQLPPHVVVATTTTTTLPTQHHNNNIEHYQRNNSPHIVKYDDGKMMRL
jgi:hypothetical protein